MHSTVRLTCWRKRIYSDSSTGTGGPDIACSMDFRPGLFIWNASKAFFLYVGREHPNVSQPTTFFTLRRGPNCRIRIIGPHVIVPSCLPWPAECSWSSNSSGDKAKQDPTMRKYKTFLPAPPGLILYPLLSVWLVFTTP